MEEREFYVYAYLDPRKPGNYVYEDYKFEFEPFYVGKGTKGRYKEHLKSSKLNSNNLKVNKIKKIKLLGIEPIIQIVEKSLNEKKILDLEIQLIKLIGRFDLKTGVLTNLTDGGEGTSGHIMSEEMKEKISKLNKGRITWNKGLTKETDLRLKQCGEEISKSNKGKIAWNKGLTKESDERVKQYVDKHHVEYTEKVINKMKKAAQNRCQTEEHKKNFQEMMNKEEVKIKRRNTLRENKSRLGKNNGNYNKQIDVKLLKLYNEQKTIAEISKEMNIGIQMIKRHLKINGITNEI